MQVSSERSYFDFCMQAQMRMPMAMARMSMKGNMTSSSTYAPLIMELLLSGTRPISMMTSMRMRPTPTAMSVG